MKTLIMLVLVSAALVAAPSAGYADETPVEPVVVDVDNIAEVLDFDPEADHVVGPILAAANTDPTGVGVPNEVVPAEGVAETKAIEGAVSGLINAPDVETSTADAKRAEMGDQGAATTEAEASNEAVPVEMLDGLQTMIQKPSGLAVVVGALVWALMEMLKGFVASVAAWEWKRKWALSLASGAVIGVLFGLFGGAGYGWLIGMIAGITGAAYFSGIRTIGKVIRGAKGAGGFVRPTLLCMMAALAALTMMLAGCGHVFTVKPGDQVRWDLKPTAPAHAAVYVEDIETCRVNVPAGNIAIKNTCPAGEVSTMDVTGQVPTCLENPCPDGQVFTFLTSGLAVCQ